MDTLNVKKPFRYTIITGVVLLLLVAVTVAYSLFYNAKAGNAYLTPVPLETVFAYQVNYPIYSKLDAVIAARKELASSRLRSKEIPKVVYIDYLIYGKAKDKTIPKNASSNDVFPLYKMIWIVVFEGQWRIEGGPVEPIQEPTHTLVPHSQSSNLLTPTIPPNRCVYVLFAGSISGEGGAVGGIYDCERWKE